jgi:hypothetical protein
LRGQGGLLLLEGGYLILLATLLQAIMVSAALILLPLWTLRRAPARPGSRVRIGGYFLALGLAFLFVEMAFIQRFSLFLGSPLYTVAVVLCAFLVFAGLGSGYATRLSQRRLDDQHRRQIQPVTLAVTGIVLIAPLYVIVLPPLFLWCLALPDAARIALTLVLIAPLAFCMGLPFPLGLAQVAARLPDMLPWAWAMNGCASVLGAILATLLAIHHGFTVVVGLALGLYVLAATLLRQPP